MIRFGIDLGGTKIEIIALDEAGNERLRRRIDTPAHSYEEIIKALSSLVEDAERDLSCRATVGIGMPGAISPKTGLIKNANTVCLNGRNLQQDLGAALSREVRLCNDANCFALSEATDGAAAKDNVVFGVIIGTGVGGGIVVHNKALTGINSIAGEWGHNPLPWPQPDELPGPRCYCGKSGCVEAFCSGPGLSRYFHALTGQRLTAREIAASPSPEALHAMEIYCDRLARALATVINVVDPDAIVLGGGLSQIDTLYQRVPMLWGKYVFSDHVATKLLKAKFGDSSGVRGAAWLW